MENTSKTEAKGSDSATNQNSKKRSGNNTTANLKKKARKIQAKVLSSYYGNPIKDMKLICITGTTGKVEVAHFVHEILRAAGHPVAILASESDFRLSTLHRFLSNAWKSGANYVIVTAPADTLKKDTFYGLPIHVAALTNFIPSSLDDPNIEEYLKDNSILFKMNPKITVLNRDDAYYQDFSDFTGKDATLTYGSDRFSTVQIIDSKLYKMGVEAKLSIGNTKLTTATFLTGEPAVSYMAAATTIADALHISPEKISEGISSYDPNES